MNTTHDTTQTRLDIRIILSGLWVARMLSGLQGDTVRLSDPAALQSIISESGPINITDGLLLTMSVLFVFPILMSVLTLVLSQPLNRWANRILGAFFALFDLGFLGLALFQWGSAGYEIVWSVAYAVFTFLIAWYAWTWPAPDTPVG